MSAFFLQRWLLMVVCGLSMLWHVGGVFADDMLPIELKGVGVTEHRGEVIPLQRSFVDETGRAVRLADYFKAGRPVMMVMAYYTCPMLCSIVLNKLTEGMKGVAWTPGVEYDVVTVSIDPRDKPPVASAKKANYIKEYGRPQAADGWHFLTGQEEDIKALADSLGFAYKWDDATEQYLHSAVVMFITPEGRISRYLGGLEYTPRDLRLALLEASEGKIGSAIDRILLFCFHYDPVAKKYAIYARNVMRLGGGITAIIIGLMLVGYWRLERSRGERQSIPS